MRIGICFCGRNTTIGEHTRFVFTKTPKRDTMYINVSRIGDNCIFENVNWFEFPEGSVPDNTTIRGNLVQPTKIVPIRHPFPGTAILYGEAQNLKNWTIETVHAERVPLLKMIKQFKKNLPSLYQRIFILGAEGRKQYREQLESLNQLICMLKNS